MSKDAVLQFPAEEILAPPRPDMFTVSDKVCEDHYAHLKDFWIRRDETIDEDEIARLNEKYRTSTDAEDRRGPAEEILAAAGRFTAEGRVCKVLELGCANGSLIYQLRALGRDADIRLTGIEPFKPFAGDFAARLPEHRIICADAEAFTQMGPEDFPEAPFDIFYESGALCMAAPRVARAALAKGASLCREIVVNDYILNGTSDVNTEDTLLFLYSRPGSQVYFAHNFPRYLGEIGFETTSVKHFRTFGGARVDGWGVLRAAPKDGTAPK